MKEQITLKDLEIKRERLKGIRPLTKDERKVKTQIEMIGYFNKVIDKLNHYIKEEGIINTSDEVAQSNNEFIDKLAGDKLI